MEASSLLLDSRYNGLDGPPWGARGIRVADKIKHKNMLQKQKRVMLVTLGIHKIHSTHTIYKITKC